MPRGVSSQQAEAILDRFRRSETTEPAELFLLLLHLAMPGAQQTLGVSDQEREQLREALAPHLF